MYKIVDMRCEGLERPLGVGSAQPVFSWKIASDTRGETQARWSLRVRAGEETLWETGAENAHPLFVRYAGKPLCSDTAYVWEVTSQGSDGASVAAASTFETAYLQASDWEAKWVEPVQEPAWHEPPRSILERKLVPLEEVRLQPANLVRRSFTLRGDVRRARARVTAHGVYALRLNGNRVGDIQLAPGSTSYRDILEYQTYDVTSDLRAGGNALLICVADGWYTGKHGMIGRSCPFGDKTAVLFQIDVEYEDGGRERILSDAACRCHTASVRYADLFVGECQDARAFPQGCDLPGYDDSAWKDVILRGYGYENLRAQYAEPVRVVETRKPARVYKSPKGEWILDAGQVLAGRLRMRVHGPAGTKVVLEHSETVDADGCFFNNILGFFVHQTDTYILRGGEEEVFDPEFTYHGFQYARITGYPGTPTVEDFDVLVVASDLRARGAFACSNADINQLQHNIVWSQRSNLISVPTDCPQREKSGWTGDAQIYGPTACFNADALGFYKRWLASMRADQQPDGQVPVVIPYIEAYHPNGFFFYDTHTSAAWGDAAVLLPWTLYQSYGDVSVLEENYEMMCRWIGYVAHTAASEVPKELEGKLTDAERERQKYLWNTHMHFGDWLAPSVSVDPETGDINLSRTAFYTMDIVPTCFFAGSTRVLAQVAQVLGKEEDARRYRALFAKIQKAFLGEYIGEDGLIRKRLQGVYVLAIHMGLLEGEARQRHVRELVRMIHENGDRLDTGFVSVPYLMDVLSDNGEWETAEALLMQEECPSWLYQVKHGATSMWEAWQAILPDGTKTSVSYNHYALGCIGQWIYRKVGGLDADLPGYARILFDPHPLGGITWADTSVETGYGKARIRWRLEGETLVSDVTVPVGATARFALHGRKAAVDGHEVCGEDAMLCSGEHTVRLL